MKKWNSIVFFIAGLLALSMQPVTGFADTSATTTPDKSIYHGEISGQQEVLFPIDNPEEAAAEQLRRTVSEESGEDLQSGYALSELLKKPRLRSYCSGVLKIRRKLYHQLTIRKLIFPHHSFL